MKYILILFLLSSQLNAWTCKEPEWLGICDQIRMYSSKDLDVVITIQKQKRGWVRFQITNKESDKSYGYARYNMGQWDVIGFGSSFSPEDIEKLKIPDWIK